MHSALLSLLGVVILGILGKKMIELSRMEVFRLLSVLVLTLLITVFWSFFELAGTAITLFAERNVNLTLLNASQTNAINPWLYNLFSYPIFYDVGIFIKNTKKPNYS